MVVLVIFVSVLLQEQTATARNKAMVLGSMFITKGLRFKDNFFNRKVRQEFRKVFAFRFALLRVKLRALCVDFFNRKVRKEFRKVFAFCFALLRVKLRALCVDFFNRKVRQVLSFALGVLLWIFLILNYLFFLPQLFCMSA